MDKTPIRVASMKKGKILNIEQYKIKKKIEAVGLEWAEDKKGKFRVWIRLKNDFRESTFFQ